MEGKESGGVRNLGSGEWSLCHEPGPPGELYRGCKVSLTRGGQDWLQPRLILAESFELKVFANSEHGGNGRVPLRAASGNKVLGDFGIGKTRRDGGGAGYHYPMRQRSLTNACCKCENSFARQFGGE